MSAEYPWWDYEPDDQEPPEPLTEAEIAHGAIAEQQEAEMEAGLYDDDWAVLDRSDA